MVFVVDETDTATSEEALKAWGPVETYPISAEGVYICTYEPLPKVSRLGSVSGVWSETRGERTMPSTQYVDLGAGTAPTAPARNDDLFIVGWFATRRIDGGDLLPPPQPAGTRRTDRIPQQTRAVVERSSSTSARSVVALKAPFLFMALLSTFRLPLSPPW